MRLGANRKMRYVGPAAWAFITTRVAFINAKADISAGFYGRKGVRLR